MSSVLVTSTQRSFGGKSGTWFRKRRFQQALATEAKDGSTTSSLISSLRVENRAEREDASAGTISQAQGRTGTEFVGWDDFLCRAVYKSSENENTNKTVTGGGAEEDNREESSQYMSSSQGSLEQKRTSQHQGPFKRIRSYGGFRRNRKILADDDNHTSKDFFDPLPNAPKRSIIPKTACKTDDKAKEDDSKEGKDEESYESSSIFDFQGDTAPAKGNDACLTPPKEMVHAVSSKTSLSVAREFFRKLDDEHKLNISAEPSSSPKRKLTVRSSRIRTLHTSRVVLEEYNEYNEACLHSNVRPLSQEEYVSNRAFFRSNSEAYDGFLDE